MSGGSSLCCGGCSDKGAECAAFAAGRCGHRPLQSSKNRTSFDFHTSNIYRTAIYECRNCYARPKGVRTMVGITITRTTERLVFQARKRYSLPQRLFFAYFFLTSQKKVCPRSESCAIRRRKDAARGTLCHQRTLSPVRLQVVHPVIFASANCPSRLSGPVMRTSRPPSVRAVSSSPSLPSTSTRIVLPT